MRFVMRGVSPRTHSLFWHTLLSFSFIFDVPVLLPLTRFYAAAVVGRFMIMFFSSGRGHVLRWMVFSFWLWCIQVSGDSWSILIGYLVVQNSSSLTKLFGISRWFCDEWLRVTNGAMSVLNLIPWIILEPPAGILIVRIESPVLIFALMQIPDLPRFSAPKTIQHLRWLWIS